MYYVFEGNNKYSRYLYTEEQAREAFATLENCTNCTNCENCKDCTNCIDCKDCMNGEKLIGKVHHGYLNENDTLLFS